MAKATQDVIVRIKVDGAGNAKVQIDQLGKSFLDAEVAAKKMTDEIADGSKIAEGSVGHYRRMITAMKIVRDNSAKTAEDFQRQTLAIEKLQVEMREITSSTKSYNKVNEKQISNAGLAGATLTEFGRTISDLPYGIRGVANNLSQLSTLFITLTAKTKGFKNSIKLLKTELMGPLGFILIFQAVISLLDFFAGKTDKAKESTDELTDSFNEELIVLQKLNEAIKNNSIARDEALEIAEATLKTDKRLKQILEDETLSAEQRNEKILELSKIRQKELDLDDKIKRKKRELIDTEMELSNAVEDRNDKIEKANKLGVESYTDITGKVVELTEVTDESSIPLGNIAKSNNLITSTQKKQSQQLLELSKLYKEQNDLVGESVNKNEDLLQVGTIAYYQDLIKELRGVQNENTTTNKQFNDLQREIDFFQAKIDAITGSTKKLTKANKKQKESFDELIGISGSFYGEFFKQSQEINDKAANLSRQRRKIEFADIKTVLAEDIAALKQRSLTREGFEVGKERLIKESLEKEIKAIKFALDNDILTTEERLKLRQRLANITTKLADSEVQKYIDGAKHLMRHFEFILEAFTASNDAQISIEERRTVLANNQLKKRLQNEKLSAKQKESINNQIAANEERLQKKRDEIAEKNFKLQKAVSIGQALISTAEMATDAFGTIKGMRFLGPAALPLAYAAAAAATAFGLKQVDAIRRTQFVPSATGGGGGASGGGGSSIQAPDFNVVGASAQSQLATTVAGQQARPVKAFVVGKDISTQQELDRNISNTASFG